MQCLGPTPTLIRACIRPHVIKIWTTEADQLASPSTYKYKYKYKKLPEIVYSYRMLHNMQQVDSEHDCPKPSVTSELDNIDNNSDSDTYID